jgi:hypothetical protein
VAGYCALLDPWLAAVRDWLLCVAVCMLFVAGCYAWLVGCLAAVRGRLAGLLATVRVCLFCVTEWCAWKGARLAVASGWLLCVAGWVAAERGCLLGVAG